MFREDYQKEDIPKVCTTVFERMNEYILSQEYTERDDMHWIRDTYKASLSGSSWVGESIFFKLYRYLKNRHGEDKGTEIYMYIAEGEN